MTPKQQIILLLPKLNPVELNEVHHAVKAASSLQQHFDDKEVSRIKSNVDDLLLDACAQYLASKGLVADKGSIYHMTRLASYEHYKKKRPGLDSFIGRIAGSLGTKGNRYMSQVCFLCVSSLGDMLQNRGHLLPSTLLTQIDKIPEALDMAFPGYVESGMFKFVILNTSSERV